MDYSPLFEFELHFFIWLRISCVVFNYRHVCLCVGQTSKYPKKSLMISARNLIICLVFAVIAFIPICIFAREHIFELSVEIWAIMCINYFVLVFSRVFLFYWHLHLCLYLHPCIWAGAYSFAQGGWDGGDGGCDDVRASTRSAPEPMCSRATSLSYLCAFFKCISTSL